MTYKFVTDLGRKHQSTRESEDRVTEEPVKHYVTVTQQEQEPEPVRHVCVTQQEREPEPVKHVCVMA